MKKLLIATTAIALTAVPAHAQLLGNGSLTGGLTSGLDLGSTISRTTETVRTTTRSAVNGSAKTDGDQKVDRKSGRVEARRSADIAGAADIGQLATTPFAPIGAAANGSGQASGNGEAQAQLLGTDAVRGVAGSTFGQAHSATEATRSVASPLVSKARGAATTLPGSLPAVGGSANGEGSGAAEGSAGLASMPLAVAGSAASAANGAASVAPGMPVVTPEGLPLGKVREIVADSRGQVQHVLISNGDASTLIPAGSVTASGNALIAGEGKASAESDGQDVEPENAEGQAR